MFLPVLPIPRCNRRKPCAVFMLFMNGKLVTYSCPERVSLGCSNTLSAIVIHFGGIIYELHGFEYLLMMIEDVHLFVVTADREFKYDGCYALIIFERDVYSVFDFPHE